MRARTVAVGVAVAVVVALAISDTAAIRRRADAALGKGMPAREAALGRGFVLGEDEQVDRQTVSDFRRAGLSHLLAVSGQNVALLGLLAMPLLAALGLPLKARLLWVLGLIAVYVPLAGAAASIQRAGVMGALNVLATLAGRRSSRLYGLGVAALVLLVLEPGIAADVGWQLSFAAVLGILALAPPLAAIMARRPGFRRGVGRALADGVAMTAAATIATAPLIAFHFGELSTVSLFANLMALPAVAPAMWLGMLAAAAGQVPGLPVAPLNAVDAPLLAYVAQVAAWCGRPSWACLHVDIGLGGLLGSYAAIVATAVLAPHLLRRRRLLRRRLAAALAALCGLFLLGFAQASGGVGAAPAHGLRVSVLDVGQGDAILLQPAGSRPVLVDAGPPGDGISTMLRAAGVDSLGALVVTHDQSDHAGGLSEVAGEVPVERLVFGVPDRRLLAAATAAGARPEELAAGGELRSGGLRLDVLWPPRSLLGGSHAGEDPNLLALVMVARWHRFSMLLTADAEAESIPIDPGPIDVLKVAHHGSDDAGLGALLDRIRPRLAVISVGEDNPYGHPTAGTLATLASHDVPALRTDRDGTIVIEVQGGRVGVDAG
jgi:competence protein ComEC